jgi:hypothetical protein
MNRIAIFMVAVLLLATAAAYADTGLFCPFGAPCRSQVACCPGNGNSGPSGGSLGTFVSSPPGPTSTGDPLILADQTTFERVLDYATDTPNGRLAFARSYSSTYVVRAS